MDRERLMNIARSAVLMDRNLDRATKTAIHAEFDRLEALDGDEGALDRTGRNVFDPSASCEICERARAETDTEGARFGIKAGELVMPVGRLPQFLDDDGVLVALTGRPGFFGHSVGDAYVPCPRFGSVLWLPSAKKLEGGK